MHDLGLFVMNTDSGVANNDVSVIAPTTSPGNARWVWIETGQKAAGAYGIPTVDSTGRIPLVFTGGGRIGAWGQIQMQASAPIAIVNGSNDWAPAYVTSGQKFCDVTIPSQGSSGGYLVIVQAPGIRTFYMDFFPTSATVFRIRIIRSSDDANVDAGQGVSADAVVSFYVIGLL